MFNDLKQLQGKTLEFIGMPKGGFAGPEYHNLYFFTNDGVYEMYYEQDCCAECSIIDVTGDPRDIYDTHVTLAEERSSEDYEDIEQFSENAPTIYQTDESFTWTFCEIQTPKGDLTIRWYGYSNGYYSESPSFRPCYNIPEDIESWDGKLIHKAT